MQASKHSCSMQTHRCFTCSTVPPSSPCGVRLQALFTSLKSNTPKHNPHAASSLATTAVRTEAPVSSPVSPPTASASSSRHSTPSMDLFDNSHITWTPALILYFPFGCVLALARICLWITGIALDLPAFRNPEVISMYLRLLGVKVVWKNVERVPAGGSSQLVLFFVTNSILYQSTATHQCSSLKREFKSSSPTMLMPTIRVCLGLRTGHLSCVC